MDTPMPNPSVNYPPSSQDPIIVPAPVSDEIDQQEPKSKFKISFWIILLIIYGITLYSIVGYRIYKKATTTSTSQETISEPELPQLVVNTSNSATSSYDTLQYTPDILPVVTLEIWNPNEQKQLKYPSLFPIKLSKDQISSLSRFQTEGVTVIGPKEYKGGINYIDDRFSIFLYPKSSTKSIDDAYQNGESFKLFVSSIGGKSAIIYATHYFRWVRDNAKLLGIENEILPIAEQENYTALSTHLILYTDFKSYQKEGLEIYGLAFCNAEDHVQDKQWFSVFIEIATPKEKRQVAKDLLNLYIDLFDLKNK